MPAYQTQEEWRIQEGQRITLEDRRDWKRSGRAGEGFDAFQARVNRPYVILTKHIDAFRASEGLPLIGTMIQFQQDAERAQRSAEDAAQLDAFRAEMRALRTDATREGMVRYRAMLLDAASTPGGATSVGDGGTFTTIVTEKAVAPREAPAEVDERMARIPLSDREVQEMLDRDPKPGEPWLTDTERARIRLGKPQEAR